MQPFYVRILLFALTWGLLLIFGERQSKAVPITYSMELLKGATISGLGYADLLYPLSILLLMGVVLMGIGIRLIEKRHV